MATLEGRASIPAALSDQAELPFPDGATEEAIATPPPPARPRWRRRLAWALRIVTLLALAGAGVATALYVRALRSPSTIAGLRVGGEPVGGLGATDLEARLGQIADRVLDEPLVMTFGAERVRARRRDAGLAVDRARLLDAVRSLGRSGDPLVDLPLRRAARRGGIDLPVPLTVERGKSLDFLLELKETLDAAAVDAHLDLDHHLVAAERAGRLLQVYESLGRLEDAVDRSSLGDPIELAAVVTPARVKKDDLAGIDISTVLGAWETKYSSTGVDSDRTYNLKVGADHLNGHILKPHELFSFNDVVGDRTEKEGYRVAPVIAGGELIDGLAGGMCQIASTLHAASFFAGLEIVSSTPHSRPSAYIPLGLDSTVVYPSTDLKLRNPFDFPIVMHYQVNQGTVKVELLGKARPVKVVFEREILEEHGFGTEGRRDPQAPRGQKLVLQEGYPGYKAIRRRYVFDAATSLPKFLGPPTEPLTTALGRAKIEPLRVEKWAIHYPATSQIVAVGSGSPTLKKKPNPPSHHIPPVQKDQKPIGRIVR